MNVYKAIHNGIQGHVVSVGDYPHNQWYWVAGVYCPDSDLSEADSISSDDAFDSIERKRREILRRAYGGPQHTLVCGFPLSTRSR